MEPIVGARSLFYENLSKYLTQSVFSAALLSLSSENKRTSPAECHKSPHVVHQIHHANLDRRAGQPIHPDEHPALLIGLRTEDMLNPNSDLRFLVIGSKLFVAERLVAMAFPVNLVPVARRLQHQVVVFTPVRAVGPDVPRRIFPQQLEKDLRIVDLSRGDFVSSDQLVVVVHAHVIFVAVVRLAVLLGPARIGVLLPTHIGVVLEPLRGLAPLDLRILLAAIALLGRGHKTGIDHLTLPGPITLGVKLQIEVDKQIIDQVMMDQLLAKQPKCLGVGSLVLGVDAKKAAEAVTISYLVLQLIVREVVQVLQYQRFEHQHRIEGLSAGLTLARFLPNGVQCRTEIFPIDECVEVDQRIAFIQFAMAVSQIEETRLHKTSVHIVLVSLVGNFN